MGRATEEAAAVRTPGAAVARQRERHLRLEESLAYTDQGLSNAGERVSREPII